MIRADRYSPKQVEQKIYKWWEEKKFFSPDSGKPSSQRLKTQSAKNTNAKQNATLKKEDFYFSVVLPPPNVTGSLHLGHALNHTIQDCLVRWKKMQGLKSVWLPGTDHAGIATQIQVEKELIKTKQTRQNLGREKFLEKVWDWKHKYGGAIVHQMKRLGDSCDWSRHLFTLDPSSAAAVRKAFVHLYNKGWIYKGTRLVNWSSQLSSAISDLEVEYKEVQSHLWSIAYPLAEDPKQSLIIATTRPETLLADQAVAVHPEDDRYKKYHGKKLCLPLTNRKIPIIADSYVDPQFGTGALKITPAHDFNDYQIGKKHKLEALNILNKEGQLNKNAGAYQGLTVLEARKKIVSDLKTQGLLKEAKPYTHQVGFCSRSGSIVEPLLSEQWFMKMDHLAQRGLSAVLKGDIELIPSTWLKTFKHWMTHIEDWCISRQLWWGHRIPAWMCEECQKITVSEQEVIAKCSHCASQKIQQDEDVLDTWFSSALWPMSVLGWPEKRFEKYFYPSSVLVTAPDILFFWVARMIMMGLEFQDQIPFKKVYLHGVVRDAQGRKMSKSLGNGEDPIDLIEQYGADALRLALLYSHAKGRDVRFSRTTLEVCRNFMNKLWNSARFIEHIGKEIASSSKKDNASLKENPSDQVSKDHHKEVQETTTDFCEKNLHQAQFLEVNQQLLFRLKETELQVNQDLEDFKFSAACLQVYNFSWMEFCDWHLEWVKPIVYGQDMKQKQAVYDTLCFVFNRLLRLLHPFIPFITEEIYQTWKIKNKESVLLDEYPAGQSALFSKVSQKSVNDIEWAKEIITVIRQIRGENNIKPSVRIHAFAVHTSEKNSLKKELKNQKANFFHKLLQKHRESILFLAKLKDIQAVKDIDTTTPHARMSLPAHPETVIYVPLKDVVDTASEIQRLKKKIKNLETELQNIEKQLQSASFISKAPAKIVNEKKERFKEIQSLLGSLSQSLANLKKT